MTERKPRRVARVASPPHASTSHDGAAVLEGLDVRVLFASFPHPAWIYDRDTLRFVAVNDAAVRRYGYSRDEFLGMGIDDIRSPDELERLLAFFAVHQEPQRRSHSWLHRSKDGTSIEVEVVSQVLEVDGRALTLAVINELVDDGERALRERTGVAELMARVGLALNADLTLSDCLQRCTEILVECLDVAFARIWTLEESTGTLVLRASAGLYTHLDGGHARVKVGEFKIGRIALERQPHLTNGVVGDPQVHDQAWAARTGLVAFAGHPLVVANRVVGVMALFSRHHLSNATAKALAAIADHVALGIERCAAADANRLLASIVAGSDDAVLTKTLEGTILSWNRAAERLFGYTAAEAIGRPVSMLVPEQCSYETDVLLGAVRQGRTIVAHETARRTKDGGLVQVSLSVSPVRDATGRVVAVASIARDVTALRAAERTAIEAEARMRFALEASDSGVWECDLDTGAVRWTHTMERLHGLAPGTFEGTIDAFFASICEEDRAAARVAIEEATRTRTETNLLYRTVWPDGDVHWIASKGRAFYRDDGTPFRAAGVSSDVTERRSLEEQYRQAQKMEAIGLLAGGVAHDFNNLLTAIMAYGELLGDHLEPNSPAREELAEIVRVSESATRLTRQLLTFSRNRPVTASPLLLNTVVEETSRLLRRVIGEHISLAVDLAPGLPAVHADAGHLEQVLMNLAVNARDAMPGGGQLTIGTSAVELSARVARALEVHEGHYVRLSVVDTGVGMDAVTLARVFEPFFTTKGAGRGTGLGLATVYGIVRQAGGAIRVESEPGRGTAFEVLLPAVESGAPLADPDGDGADAGGTETLLIVEDDLAVRLLSRARLEKAGYKVLEAETPEQAVAIFSVRGEDVRLVVTDVVMPDTSGVELATRLTRVRPALRVLYISGYPDAPIPAGAPFLPKPFDGRSLRRAVRRALDGAPSAG